MFVDLPYLLMGKYALEIVGDQLDELTARKVPGEVYGAHHETIPTRARRLHPGMSSRRRKRYVFSEQK